MCKEIFKLVVAGSRDFTNYKGAEQILCSVLRNRKPEQVCIISGGARGADRVGEYFANNHGCKLMIVSADWNKHGKRAGHIRNEKMAELADATIVFWDGSSAGTENMISNTLNFNKKLLVVYYNPQTLEIMKCVDESNPF